MFCMLKLRLATQDDAQFLWIWRNDPETRSNSRTTDLVPWEDHVAWLTRRLERTDVGLYVAETNGIPVATVRLDGDEVSYTVAPEHRGKGIASELLSVVAKRFGPKRAEIKPSNVASIQAAQKSGHRVVLLDDHS
jgi:GNAT superfamily N-acetyltransferase